MLTSYHVHTVYSDGDFSVRDCVMAAASAGLDEVGISDHFALVSRGKTIEPTIRPDTLTDYFRDIRAAEEEAENRITVRYGLEADFFPGAEDALADILAQYALDYVIGSVHFVDGFLLDNSKDDWDPLTESERNDLARRYWELVTQMARSGLFDFVGHIDIHKKFGYLPTIDLSSEIEAALDAIAASDMAVELNTAGWHKDIREAYPSPPILFRCRERGIPVLITSDAHHVDHLTRDHDRAERLLREIGYSELAMYAGRKRRLVALSPGG